MIVCKCMINGRTVNPNASLSRPDLFSPTTLKLFPQSLVKHNAFSSIANTEGMYYNRYDLIAPLILLRKPNFRVLLYISHDVLTTFAVEKSIV